MSSYKGHLAGGVVTFAILMVMLSRRSPSLCTSLTWLSCSLVGSLFPDIDIKSKGQLWLYWFFFILFLALFVCGSYFLLSILAIISLIPLLVRHRGLFHRLWFICMLCIGGLLAVLVWAPSLFTIAAFDILFFFAGAVSHLWLDLGTRKMIRW